MSNSARWLPAPGFRNPALLAKMAETLDAISGGRLILGLGSGDVAHEFHAFGFPFDHAVSRFEEALQIITSLLREGYCDFHGTYYEVNDLTLEPRGPRPNGPPILIGTLLTGKRMLRLTTQYADLWNGFLCYGRNWPDVLPPIRDAIDAACIQHGRDPATLGRTVGVRVALLGEQVTGGVEPLEGTPRADRRRPPRVRALRRLACAGLARTAHPRRDRSLRARAGGVGYEVSKISRLRPRAVCVSYSAPLSRPSMRGSRRRCHANAAAENRARIPVQSLMDFTVRAFLRVGLTQPDAETMADVLIGADIRGIDSHGAPRMRMYVDPAARRPDEPGAAHRDRLGDTRHARPRR